MHQRRPRRLAVESLEHRVQPSAGFSDLSPQADPATTVAAPLPLTIVDVPLFPGLMAVGTSRAVVAPVAAEVPSVVMGSPRRELYLVALDVPDRDTLVRDLLARPGVAGEVVELIGSIHDVTATLGNRSGLDAVHLVTHGAAGAITLGADVLDATTLSHYESDLRGWGAALAPGGDLLLYGCDVAADGGAFVTRLSSLTGVDVAASTNRTGATTRGGDWVLEHTTDAVETAAFAPLGGWYYLLPAVTFQQRVAGYAGTADTFLDVENPTDPHGDEDNLYAEGGAENLQGLLRFDNLVGSGPGQIPPGATITSASLQVYTTNTADRTQVRFHRMLVPWTENSTWASLRNGVQLDGVEAVAVADVTYGGTATDKERTVTGLAAAVQAWADGAPNRGWVIVSNNAKWGFHASEKNDDKAPRLVVSYTLGNSPPTAADDAYTTLVNLPLVSTPLVVPGPGVRANDSDADGDPLTAQLLAGPANGVLTFRPDGSFSYLAVLNFAGTDSFTYRVSDGTTWSAAATVTINVATANRAPSAQPETYSTAEDTPLTVAAPGLLGNDTDPDGDTLAVVLTTGPRHGTLVLDAGGGFRYTPATDWAGTDSFSYRASDGSRMSAPVTVTLTVAPVDDPPTLDPLPDLTIAEDSGPITLTLHGISAGGGERQDLDVFAGRSDAALLAQPTGFFNTGTGEGTLVVRALPDANGTATVTLLVDDGTSTITRTFAVTVTPVNDRPDAADDGYATPQNTPLTIATAGVLANDRDIDGDPLAAVLVNGPANGTLTLNADGSFRYTPDQAFTGTDHFTYRASDGQAGSRLATVELRVLPSSGRPVADDDAYAVVGGQVLTVSAAGVLANDTRSGSAPLTAALVSGPSHGTLVFDADGSFAYTPDAGFVGLDAFHYKAADAGGETGAARVVIAVRRPNRAPAGEADAVATVAGKPVVVSAAAVLANDADPDGDAMTPELVAGAANGTVTVEADGSFTYTPADGFSGTDTFTYRVSDGQLASGLVQVTVTVSAPPTPDPPPPPADPPTPDSPAPPPATPGPTAGTPPTTASPPGFTPTPTAAAPTVSIAPSGSGYSDGYSPNGGGPAGTVSPTPAVSSGGSTSSPRADVPIASDAGRFYATGDAPATNPLLPPEAAPPPASAPPQPTVAPPEPSPAVVVLPPTPPEAPLPVAPVATTTATNVAIPDALLAPLDRIRDELRADAAERATTDSIVVTGGVAVAGVVLLNTRAVYWFLSALLARPAVWRRFDPLDVLYAWERETGRARGAGPDDSLQSMVG